MIGRWLVVLFLFGGAPALYAQAKTTASRVADAQVGVSFVSARPDYVQNTFRGFGFYGDFDFRQHLGVEAEFHRVNSPNGDQISETTYEIGARYFRTYGPFVPFIKGMVGRGVFNYPNGLANLAYNLVALGGGADLKITDHIHVRGEYEYQHWSSFPNGGLDPQLATVGVAYHFTGKPRYK